MWAGFKRESGRRTLRSPGLMNPRSYLAETLSIALFLGLSACEKKAEHAEALPPPEVLVTQAVKADVPIVRQWVGTLDGWDKADIRARVTAYLQNRTSPQQ